MAEHDPDAEAEFQRIMTSSAKRIMSGDEHPYDVGVGLMGELLPILTEADFAGVAYRMWGLLTDGIDGPPRYARGLSEREIEDLMRLAAHEWLSLDEPSPQELRGYFDRWDEWPDSLGTPEMAPIGRRTEKRELIPGHVEDERVVYRTAGPLNELR